MSPASTDHLERLLTPAVASYGADLDAVELASAGRRQVLRIVVDRDGGLTLDDIADLTRVVSRELDAHDAMGERSYTLEVTSRGVDRPLTLPRHWTRNVGRLVSVRLNDGNGQGRFTGRIAGADDQGADLEVDGEERRIPYADVAKAQVQVEFARMDG
jgi:ribosome maturation factor RimP